MATKYDYGRTRRLATEKFKEFNNKGIKVNRKVKGEKNKRTNKSEMFTLPLGKNKNRKVK